MKACNYSTLQALNVAAADHFYECANEAIAEHGRFTVALTGGSTPKNIYALMATPEYARKADWRRIELFWGDERCVPPDDPQSNFGMAQRALIAHVPVPPENVHRMRGELEPELAAAEYEKLLRDVVPDGFDLIILGMGSNAHIASLFPHSPLLQEKIRWVAAPYVAEVKMSRITLTPAAINRAREVVFWVAGEAKREAVQRVLHGRRDPDLLPAQIVAPAGEVTWMIGPL